ncbi:hypothetical protein M011DRAFT_310367 [Sporormia fimetaria CBS 119925]|uniref:Uncharacterized protein n=1 Tax=Sporormia fimetaria CBS 119925 TaxID=1340428 RepID=A0A6A6VJ06_9PLEO|nr:hypothetical protein M011DRAFT_310367 [Sporormia fimetaria CBS 119925]
MPNSRLPQFSEMSHGHHVHNLHWVMNAQTQSRELSAVYRSKALQAVAPESPLHSGHPHPRSSCSAACGRASSKCMVDFHFSMGDVRARLKRTSPDTRVGVVNWDRCCRLEMLYWNVVNCGRLRLERRSRKRVVNIRGGSMIRGGDMYSS